VLQDWRTFQRHPARRNRRRRRSLPRKVSHGALR
jgi:hypothetical protein